MVNITERGSGRYVEVQEVRRTWIGLLIVGIAVVVAAPLLPGLLGRGGHGPKAVAPASALGILAVALAVCGVLFTSRLTVTVDAHAVRLAYWPFFSRRVPLSAVACVEARGYNPILEYGGWGVRWGYKGLWRNVAYTVSGTEGVQIVLKDGHRLLIGSQNPEDLESAIRARGIERCT